MLIMEPDLVRAKVLLRDLEQLSRGQAPAIQLMPSSSDVPVIRGSSTRHGLIRLGVRLALAALDARRSVHIDEFGHVNTDSTNGVVVVMLADDSPLPAKSDRATWVDWSISAILASVFTLSVIGFVTVARWLGEVVKGG
jgi:hypothetical protein